MNRQIVYVGAIPQDVDQINQNKNTMIGLGYALQSLLGTGTLVDGLACTPTSPASLSVNVANGSIYSLQTVDATAYGSLPADTTDNIVKQGITAAQTFSCPAPTTSGFSVVYLIEAAYEDVDGGSAVLPYYNASNPSTAYNGPNNTGVSQNTVRQGVCNVQIKTGVAATTGSQVTPSADAGYTGLYAITVATGQTTITSGNIVTVSGAPIIGAKLTSLAPLASPAFTGAPTAPTASAGTSTTQIANTAFVANSFAPLASPSLTGTPLAPPPAAGANTSQIAVASTIAQTGKINYQSSASFSYSAAASDNKTTIFAQGTSGTVTLPHISTVWNGYSLTIFAYSAVTVNINSGDAINLGSAGVGVSLPAGGYAEFISDGGTTWTMKAPTVAQLLASPGYIKLPGGLILQWGTNTVSSTGAQTLAVTLPITFPNAFLNCLATDTGASTFPWGSINTSTSQITLYKPNYATSSATANAQTASGSCHWWAIGF